MDKNTLNGLLLMFLVFALFMWLTPKSSRPTMLRTPTPRYRLP